MPRMLKRILAPIGAVFLVVLVSMFATTGAANASTNCSLTKQTSGQNVYHCIDVSVTSDGFTVGYRDGATNKGSSAATLSCTSSTQTTVTWSISASVKAEADVIFGKASLEVTGSFQHSVSSQIGSTVSFSVPAHSTRYCERGVITHTISGRTYTQTCTLTSGYWSCKNSDIKTFTGSGGTEPHWNITS